MAFSSDLAVFFMAWVVGGTCIAALPNAEEILPPDTLAFITVPDVARARSEWLAQPLGRLWSSPAMGAFRGAFEARLHKDLLDPFENLTGVDCGALLDLAEGQMTFALLPNDTEGSNRGEMGVLFLLDAKSRSDDLSRLLKSARTRNDGLMHPMTDGVPAGRNVLSLDLQHPRLRALLDGAFPIPAGSAPARTTQRRPSILYLGQVGSVFFATTRSNDLSGVVARLGGALAPPLPVAPPAMLDTHSVDALLHGFLSGPALLKRLADSNPRTWAGAVGSLPPLGRLINALGVPSLRSASWAVRVRPEGWFIDAQIEVPAAARRGIFKLLEWQASEAGPLAWIPDDALSMTRLRLPGIEGWNRLQGLLRDIDPALLGVVELFTGYAGKTEDADFDFQKGIINLLGDDWTYATLPSNRSRPGGSDVLFLFATTKPDEFLRGVRLIAAPNYLATFLPPSAPSPIREERQVNGHDVITVRMPALPWPWSEGSTGIVHIARRDGYMGASASNELIQQFLSAEKSPSLARRPDFLAAVSAVGGSKGGCLSFRDERAAARQLFSNTAETPELVAGALRWAAVSATATRLVSAVAGWLDFDRLPPFEKVAQHFGIRVRRGEVTTNGFVITTFRPVPRPSR